MNIDLSGKTALVTGSTQGIGFAIAEGLADSGARVAVNGRTPERVEEAVAKLSGDVIGVAVDVTTEDGAAQLQRELADVDILVNNLGIFGAVPAREITDEQWRTYFEVNVLAAVRLIRMYLPGMTERGWGRAIQIASDSALVIPEEMIHYGVSKTALLARVTRIRQGRRGYRCHRQLRHRGADAHRRRRGLRLPTGRQVAAMGRGAARVHAQAPAAVAAAAADRTGRNRKHGDVFGVAARLGDDGRGVARRRRIRGFDRALAGWRISRRPEWTGTPASSVSRNHPAPCHAGHAPSSFQTR